MAEGLVGEDGKAIVSFHNLGHTAGSTLLSLGVPITDVSRALRHADPSITTAIYAHTLNERDRLQDAMAALSVSAVVSAPSADGEKAAA